MKRIPILSTIVVALAVAAMLWLGVWQLHRKAWKEGLLRDYAANIHAPEIAFPQVPLGDEYLFHRAGAVCLRPIAFRSEGAGARGFRVIATCGSGAGSPGLQVQLGTTRDSGFRAAWPGGDVTGYISHAPDHRALIATLWDHAPQDLMLVADTPPAGLSPNPGPNLDDVPNNHLAYAVQWFLFAAIALVIYGIALRRRMLAAPPPSV